jgi:PIN domain nuclease of toxin-antitoxin system
MGHQDKGHFAAKHQDQQIDGAIANKIKSLSNDNCLSCISAHKISKSMNTDPSEIGIQIDLLENRIMECQLGLFGYDDGKKRFDPNIQITSNLNSYLDAINDDGRISCIQCWETALKFKMKRIDVASACEKKNFRIRPCQLGAF